MNDQLLEKKIRREAAQAKSDISTLVGDGAVQVGRMEESASRAVDKAKDDVVGWVQDSASQLSEGFEKLTGEARESVVDAAATVKKNVGHGLRKYNDGAQKAADKVPGNLGKNVADYPWVSISVSLLLGFVLGILIRPTRRIFGLL